MMIPLWLFASILASPPAAPVLPAEQPPLQVSAPTTETDSQGEKEPERFQVFAEIQVTGRASDMLGVADSATEGVTGRQDLEKRPVLRPGEVLETVPGVIITQHSGSGKANQYFLRGFNLDHGTDFRVTLDGVPVNMPTHGHGQGYSDLNFLIPELVDTVRYKKGPYYADQGDFAAAGAANVTYVTSLPEEIVQVTSGRYGYGRLLAADAIRFQDSELLGAVEYGGNDGPWDRPDDFRKLNGVLRWNRGDAVSGLTVTAMGYDGQWNSTDQIPERAVREHIIGRYGLIDPTNGGRSHRYSLSAELRRSSTSSLTRASAYVVRYGLDLFSNFTYFLDDPENGDQFEQVDDRTVAGFQVERQWLSSWRGREIETFTGFQARSDDIANGLFHTRERFRLSTTRQDDVREVLASPFGQARIRWTPWLRTVAGLRADYLHADVESNLAANSGSEDNVIVSPKLSVLLGPWKETEVYLNLGYGFHSNDVRGATIRIDPRTGEPAGRVRSLVPARGADVGVRTAFLPNLQMSATLFVLDLDSELVFVGDAGGTEASRPSRRMGIELQSFFRVFPWLTLDADIAFSRGRFTDRDPAGDHIPGAIEKAVAAGISIAGLRHAFGSLRLRYFGARPLLEDDSIRSASSTLVNMLVGYRFAKHLSLTLEMFNLLDESVSDIDYFYESRLRGETEPVADIHFHPAEKRSARLLMEWRLGSKPGPARTSPRTAL